jgi:hypothetical protein
MSLTQTVRLIFMSPAQARKQPPRAYNTNMASIISGLLAVVFSLFGFQASSTPNYPLSHVPLTGTPNNAQHTYSQSSTTASSSPFTYSPPLVHTFTRLRLKITFPQDYKTAAVTYQDTSLEEIIITAPDRTHIYINTTFAPNSGSTVTIDALKSQPPAVNGIQPYAGLIEDLLGTETTPFKLNQEIVGVYYPKDRLGESGVLFEYQGVLYDVTWPYDRPSFFDIVSSISFF